MSYIIISAIVILLVIGTIASELDSLFLSIVAPAIIISGLAMYVDVSFITNNLVNTSLYAAAYVLVGILYSALWRWPRFLLSKSSEILLAKTAWEQGTKDTPFLDSYKYSSFKAKSNKDRIVCWIATWPYSLFWELVKIPTIRLWNFAYNISVDLFDSIGQKTTAKILDKVK